MEIKKLLKPELKRKVKMPKIGQLVKVHQAIKEKGKERIQIFKGLVIANKKENSLEGTFTVRRDSNGIGVERIFPLYSPNIKKIEAENQLHTRRAKLYFIRDNKKKLREKEEKK